MYFHKGIYYKKKSNPIPCFTHNLNILFYFFLFMCVSLFGKCDLNHELNTIDCKYIL